MGVHDREGELGGGPKVALVTGANRGLGAEIVKQLSKRGLKVVAAARRYGRPVADDDRRVWKLRIDVTDTGDVAAARDFITSQFGRLDILINNAGVYLDDPRRAPARSVCDYSPELFISTLDVNLIGAFRLIRAFLPIMKSWNYGRIVNVSSGMGRIVEIEPSSPFYRTSKAALNFLTQIIAAEVEPYDIKVNAVCPGWVRTDMGGREAVRSVSAGARGVIWAATLAADGPNGLLLRDGEAFGW
jgi:NAD(P)-dependent dehydrogenase (short-subunit alcohol dehydrogenase family)